MAKLPIISNDPWLQPYSEAITGRHEDVLRKEAELLTGTDSLDSFANAHKYFGLHLGFSVNGRQMQQV